MHRDLAHNSAKKACLRAEQFNVSADLFLFTTTFPDLQDLRHQADDDPNVRFQHNFVVTRINEASQALSALQRVPRSEQLDFVMLPLAASTALWSSTANPVLHSIAWPDTGLGAERRHRQRQERQMWCTSSGSAMPPSRSKRSATCRSHCCGPSTTSGPSAALGTTPLHPAQARAKAAISAGRCTSFAPAPGLPAALAAAS